MNAPAKGIHSVRKTIGYVLCCVVWMILVQPQLRCAVEEFQVVGTSVFGGSSLLIRTNGTSVSYTTVLSDDKQRLTLTIKNAGIKTEQRELNNPRGMIESAMLQKIGRDVVINVYFRESIGFTAVLLPYSRAISVDVFKWSKLNAAEDQYRSGLIALQNNALSVAKEFIASAARLQHPDATAFAGFVNAREGNYAEAKEMLLKALERKSTISDIYGGLAQVSRVENNESKAREYENQFVQRMGRPPYFDEELIKIQKVVQPTVEPSSLATLSSDSASTQSTNPDTSSKGSNGDQTTESLMSQLRQMQGQSAQAAAQIADSALTKASKTPIFSWLNSALIGLGVALIFIGLIFLRGYLNWKKQQVQYLNRVGDDQRRSAMFGSNLQHAMAVSDQQAVNVYKRGALLDTELQEDSENAATDSGSYESDTSPKRSADLNLSSDEGIGLKQMNEKTTASASTNSADSAPSNELFDFDESFYASRKPETKRSESSRKADDTRSPLYNTEAMPQLSSDAPAQPAPKSEETLPQGALLDVDADSLEALASQLGIDPALMASVKKRKSTGDTAKSV